MRFIGLIIALALAIAAGVVAFKIVAGGDEPAERNLVAETTQQDVQTTNILIAARDVPIGEKVVAEMLDSQPWPSHLVLDGFIVTGDDTTDVIGMVTRSSFQSGEPMILSKLSNPNDPSFLAASLEPGMRVVTIASDGVAAVAGFVFPGDRVDVLVTHPIPKESNDPAAQEEEETVTETLLSNVKVLAVDRRAEGGNTEEVNLPASISLEVPLEDAQRLRLGQETGYLSLALRSLEDRDSRDIPAVTYIKDLSQSDVYDKKASGKPIIIVRGTQQSEVTVSGGEEEDEEEVPEEEF